MKTTKYIDQISKTKTYLFIASMVAAWAAVIVLAVYFNNRLEASSNRVYVMVGGNSLEYALSKDASINRRSEAENHLKMFHGFFYNLDPDPDDIKKSINKALNLGDNSVRDLYLSRNESLYYHKLVDASISSRIEFDSIKIDMRSEPHSAIIYAKQNIIRSTKTIHKNLIATCQLRQSKRTDNNPHGFIIERYRIVNSDIIDETNR